MGFRVERHVMVPMRDGVTLATDAWIPDGRPAPAILVRNPYSKDNPAGLVTSLLPNALTLLDAGYAVVWQDCRGTFGSGGEFDPMLREADDGVDTIAWLRVQP